MRASKFVALVAATVFVVSSAAVAKAESLITKEAAQVMTEFTSEPKFMSDKFLVFGVAITDRGKLDYAGHLIQLIHIDLSYNSKVIELASRYNQLNAQLTKDEDNSVILDDTTDSTSDRISNLLAEAKKIFSSLKKNHESVRQDIVGIIKSSESSIDSLEEYISSQEAMIKGEAKVVRNFERTTTQLRAQIENDIASMTYADDVINSEHLNDAGRYLEKVVRSKKARVKQLEERFGNLEDAERRKLTKFLKENPDIAAWEDESNSSDLEVVSDRIDEAVGKMKQDLKVKRQNVQIALAIVYAGVGLVDLGDAAAKGTMVYKYVFNDIQEAIRSSKLKTIESAIASGAISQADIDAAQRDIEVSKEYLADAKEFLRAAKAEEEKLENYIDGLESFSNLKGLFERSIF